MDERPEQPPEGRLLAEALERAGMSIRQASRLAGISYGRWRQIVSGVQNVSPGSYARVTAPAATLARMAAVVRVTPRQLDDAGRPDAAAALRQLLPVSENAASPGEVRYSDPSLQRIWEIPNLSVEERLGAIAWVRARRAEQGRNGAEHSA